VCCTPSLCLILYFKSVCCTPIYTRPRGSIIYPPYSATWEILTRLPRPQRTPRTATSTKVAAPTALGFLDIGTRATTSHELLTSILYSPSFCDVTPSTTFRYHCGGMSAHCLLRFSLQSDRSQCSSCSRCYRYGCGGMLEYTCCTRLD
jgi:hypothetical protein